MNLSVDEIREERDRAELELHDRLARTIRYLIGQLSAANPGGFIRQVEQSSSGMAMELTGKCWTLRLSGVVKQDVPGNPVRLRFCWLKGGVWWECERVFSQNELCREASIILPWVEQSLKGAIQREQR